MLQSVCGGSFCFLSIPLLEATPSLPVQTSDFSARESFPAPEGEMTTRVQDFIDQPALEKTDNLKKDEILAIARHYKIPLKQKERKAELKKKLTDELQARGVLPPEAEGGGAEGGGATSPLEDFIASPSHQKIWEYKKKDLIGIAEYYGISVSPQEVRTEIQVKIRKELMCLDVLPAPKNQAKQLMKQELEDQWRRLEALKLEDAADPPSS